MRTKRRIVVDWPLRRPDPVEQPSLWSAAPMPHGELSISERFELFHARNPQVYQRLHELALAEVQAGRRRISTKRLYEELRVDGDGGATGPGDYRYNNDFTALYARKLVEDPRLAGLIELRQRKAE